jgi:hypothetical protein
MKETVEENTSTTERVFQDRQYQVLYLYILASEKAVSLVAEWAASCFMDFFFISAMNCPWNLLYIVSLKNMSFCLLQLIFDMCWMHYDRKVSPLY